MFIRIASAFVASVVLLTAAGAGGWWFGAFALLIVGMCLDEFFAMALPNDTPSRVAGVTLGLAVVFTIFTGSFTGDGGLFVITLVIVLPVLWFLARPGELESVAARMGLSTLGILWVAVLGGLSSSLVFLEEGFSWLVLAGFLSFGSDAGGYFFGRVLGRTKLSPHISPKKTWEGALAGVLVATAMAFVLWATLGPPMDGLQLAWLAPVVSAFGQLGDLAESMLKRSVGVKDSGAVMPGHGGVFDRIDAFLFVAAPLFLFARVGLDVKVVWLGL